MGYTREQILNSFPHCERWCSRCNNLDVYPGRDGFTCKTCGRSPINEKGVKLHVDHIVPWSKGGETIPDNLETKCEQCNLGKGNAFIDKKQKRLKMK